MTMPSGETSPPLQKRWIKGALIASLALNLLIIGIVAGGIWRFRHHGAFGLAERGLMGFINHLPTDRAQLLRGEVTSKREGLRPLRREANEAWQASNDVLTAEPFDKEKFKAAQAKARESSAKLEAAVADTMADLAEKLNPDERKHLRNWRERQRERMFGHHGHHDGPGKANDD
jgi:uncharacterized membrane protein